MLLRAKFPPIPSTSSLNFIRSNLKTTTTIITNSYLANNQSSIYRSFSASSSSTATSSSRLPSSNVLSKNSAKLIRSFHSSKLSNYVSSPPPPSSSPSFSASPPLSFAARSKLFRISTRRQILELQTELEILRRKIPKNSKRLGGYLTLLLGLTALIATYYLSNDFRRIILAGKRSANVGYGVARCIIDYKLLFRNVWDEDEAGKIKRHNDFEDCHRKCAVRMREVLKKNGGIYIKLGQHISSIQLIPTAWSETMKPLQDQCFPTALEDLQALFLSDVGAPLSTFFSSFDPVPIGVASLAQVHVATDRSSGRAVAVKIMHPELEEFCAVDIKTTVLMLRIVKRVFPTFEFTWLGEEMQENLPLEMDFRHEAANARRCDADFASLEKTTLVVPEVLWAQRRVMVMEFIEGSRIDDLEYLAKHSIDRNRVAQQLSHIFSRMIYITGFFHADPHGGNLLIRPKQPGSRSPYNFEIVLLDHGLYFDMSEDLRVNYSRLWLSLIAPSTPAIELERRKYAYLAGNIDETLYPIFQAAITGRAALETTAPRADGTKPSSMLELGVQTKEDLHALRHAMTQAGLMQSIFDLLRRVPRRMLMVLKVNDLTRALDASLKTTHGASRIFLIVAHYCNLAVYLDDKNRLASNYRASGISMTLVGDWIATWWRYQSWNLSISILQQGTDLGASVIKYRAWWRGFRREGYRRAWQEAAGIL